MPKITPFLWFDNNLDEAINFYDNVFENVRIDRMQKTPDGSVFGATFEIEGQEFMALNGGPAFKFNEAISLFVSCDSQEEIDHYWDSLTADGGSESQCGWLKDKYGLSWQIVPSVLGDILGDSNPVKAEAAMQAMLSMRKLDIAALEVARDKAGN